MNRNTWLPVSAQECELSASIEAEPVISATTVLAPAMSRLAKNAMITVSVLSPPPSSASGMRRVVVVVSVMGLLPVGQRSRSERPISRPLLSYPSAGTVLTDDPHWVGCWSGDRRRPDAHPGRGGGGRHPAVPRA